ncbi:hypothetical protein FHW02_003572 [Ochrobactrum sp. RH1CCR137]|nr:MULTISPECIES: hypothetical protein [unclassified Ochrobactrum]MBA8845490.1 hypothetical protein [Ochrobactrum sp. RH1CCR137]MBA8857212.1 hypothetical protein [Ochrobactrum sp. RH1CCR134]
MQSGCIACAMPISPGFISIRVASFHCSGRQQGEHGNARICVCGAKAGSAWIWQVMGCEVRGWGGSRKAHLAVAADEQALCGFGIHNSDF